MVYFYQIMAHMRKKSMLMLSICLSGFAETYNSASTIDFNSTCSARTIQFSNFSISPCTNPDSLPKYGFKSLTEEKYKYCYMQDSAKTVVAVFANCWGSTQRSWLLHGAFVFYNSIQTDGDSLYSLGNSMVEDTLSTLSYIPVPHVFEHLKIDYLHCDTIVYNIDYGYFRTENWFYFEDIFTPALINKTPK